ncbi:hypothetical protein [Winogradskyella pulchriflava]|uniref:Lipocalin-like domain-containing protein n=1 Tax=Winogradskyella pulchriflava TaxID=1110688 RepID=A0ABV6Q8Q0_9FLAO
MKTKTNKFFLLAFFALLCFTSCLNEETEVNTPNEQETIEPTSQLATLMSMTTAHFGGMDDILDDSSCFSIELPVTIIVGDITIIIETEADLGQLEDLFEQFEDDDDFLDFVFPITLIFSDYTEVVIENEDQLENFINECDDDDLDDVIECVNFVYPISFSVFNSEFNLIDTVVIENDEALYQFLDDLEDDDSALIVSLNYPVTLEYTNGDTVEVNSNQELAQAIEAAGDDCDDDEYDCNEEDIAELLVACPWDIDDENNDFEIYQIIFNEDGSLAITEGETTSAIGGNWTLTSTDNGLILHLFDLTAFQGDLGGEWLIVDCDDDEIEIVRGDYAIELEQDCEDDLECFISDINELLGESCAWRLETNLIDSVVPIYVYFTPNGQVLVDNGNGTENQIGTYELMLVAGNVFIELSLQQGFNDLSGQWQVVECDDDDLYLVNGDNYIDLEEECDLYEGDEVFNCFGDFEIVECHQPNNVPIYNLSTNTVGLIDCQYPFAASFHTTIADAENNTNAIVETEAYGTLESQVYLRIEAASGNYQIYTVYLNTEECDYFGCFEDRVVEVCDEGVFDGSADFDLNAIYDCPEDNVEWSFHTSIADAETSVNPLISPFTNYTNPQTIYVRVQLAGNPSAFEVFEVELIVSDCTNTSGCGEADVDAFLTSCIWNAVNYNGSDNLMEWNFSFNASNQIVIIYTDTDTIDATWTTSQSNDGVIVTFTNVAGPNIQAISGEWLVVECEEDRLELHRGDDILVLERTCN